MTIPVSRQPRKRACDYWIMRFTGKTLKTFGTIYQYLDAQIKMITYMCKDMHVWSLKEQ